MFLKLKEPVFNTSRSTEKMASDLLTRQKTNPILLQVTFRCSAYPCTFLHQFLSAKAFGKGFFKIKFYVLKQVIAIDSIAHPDKRTPLLFFQGLSHRNLMGSDMTDCSFIFLYILCTMSIRQNIQKALGFAPSRAASKQTNMWAPDPNKYKW